MPVTGNGYETDDLESFIHVSSIRVKYYRSFEYRLKWKIPMYRQRSSRVSKTSEESPEKSPSPNKEVIQRRLRFTRRRTALRKTKADNNIVKTHRGRYRDIIDIINNINDDKHIAEEDEGEIVQAVDEGVDNSDEDCCSVTSSIASGPSLQHSTTAKTPRASQDVCSACQKLYKKAKKMKAPIKPKLIDSDPKSLNCDQWVLIKNRRSRRRPNARGKLLNCEQLVKKRLEVKNDAKQTEQCTEEEEPSACSRPHAFLQRNLQQCVRVSVKKVGKKNRRKRTREDSQGPRVSKQKRLHSSNHHQHSSADILHNNSCIYSTSSHSTTPSFEGWNKQQIGDEAETHLTVELIPSKVTLEQTPKPREVPPKQKAPKKTGGFRDLLTQMRGNNSMIIRETCQPGD